MLIRRFVFQSVLHLGLIGLVGATPHLYADNSIEGVAEGSFYVGTFSSDDGSRIDAVLAINRVDQGAVNATLALKNNPAVQRKFSGTGTKSGAKLVVSLEADPTTGAGQGPALLRRGNTAALTLTVRGDQLTSPSFAYAFRLTKTAAAFDMSAPATAATATGTPAPTADGAAMTDPHAARSAPTVEANPDRPVPSGAGAYVWEDGNWQKLGSAKLKPLMDILGFGAIFAKSRDVKVEGEASRMKLKQVNPTFYIRATAGKVFLTSLTPKKGVRTQKVYIVPNKQPAQYDFRPEDLIPYVETEMEPGLRKFQLEVALSPGEHLLFVGDWTVDNGIPVQPPAFDFCITK